MSLESVGQLNSKFVAVSTATFNITKLDDSTEVISNAVVRSDCDFFIIVGKTMIILDYLMIIKMHRELKVKIFTRLIYVTLI